MSPFSELYGALRTGGCVSNSVQPTPELIFLQLKYINGPFPDEAPWKKGIEFQNLLYLFGRRMRNGSNKPNREFESVMI